MIESLNELQPQLADFLTTRSSVPIVTVDARQRITACNDGFLKMFSLSENPIGVALADFLISGAEDITRIEGEHIFTSNPRSGVHGTLVAHCMPCRDGVLLWCERLLTTNNQVVEQMTILNNELISMQRELDKKNHYLNRIQLELQEKVVQLELAISQVKRLEGIIPICMFCKKIRDSEELWHNLEQYITEHSDALFSHGMCPECFEEKYGDYANKKST